MICLHHLYTGIACIARLLKMKTCSKFLRILAAAAYITDWSWISGNVHCSQFIKGNISKSYNLKSYPHVDTAQEMKFSIKDFFSKWHQIRSFPRIWSHLLKKSLIENFIFCAVWYLLLKVGSVKDGTHSENNDINKLMRRSLCETFSLGYYWFK